MPTRSRRFGAYVLTLLVPIQAAAQTSGAAPMSGQAFDDAAAEQAKRYLEEGRETFRFDTFGERGLLGRPLRLHQAIAGEKNGGVGPGVSPEKALALGLKVDINAIPADVAAALGRARSIWTTRRARSSS